MKKSQPNDLISTAEARQLIGVSHTKMAELLRDGVVRHYSDPLDKRVKLVSQAEVLALKVRARAA